MGGGNMQIECLIDTINTQAETIRLQQLSIKEKDVMISNLTNKISDLTNKITEPTKQANQIDIKDTVEEKLVTGSKDRYINLHNDLMTCIRYIDIIYDTKVNKLFYLITLKNKSDMKKFVELFNLKENTDICSAWSYNDLETYMNHSFVISYDMMNEKLPAMMSIIEKDTNLSNKKTVSKYVSKKLLGKIEFTNARAEMDPIKCSTEEDVFIVDLFTKYYNTSYDSSISKIIMSIEDAKQALEYM